MQDGGLVRGAGCCLALLLALLSGCQSVSREQLQRVPDQVQEGRTTTAEVQALLGKPDRRRIEDEGETWIYGGAKERSTGEVVANQAVGIGAGFIPVPYVGTAVSGILSIGRSMQSSSAKHGAAFIFNEDGVLQDYYVDLP